MTKVPHAAHDRLFHALIEDDGRAERLLRALLRDRNGPALSATPFERVDGSFIDGALRRHQTDGLFRVQLAGGAEAQVYLLVEHKSTRPPDLPVQLLRYMTRIWSRHIGTGDSRPGVLPPVIPVLVYHGVEPWTWPHTITEMIEAPEPLREFVRRLSFVLYDLGRTEVAGMPEDPDLRASLAALRHFRDPRVSDEVLGTILSGAPSGSTLEIQLLTYIVGTYDINRDRLEAALRAARPEKWSILMGTVADELIRKGEAIGKTEGIAIGEARGEKRGKAEGKAETLLRQMRRRFGELPGSVETRVRVAALAELDGWLDAVLDADSLDAVLAAPPRT